MKTFTYVAAIALLTAGTAFAQSSPPNGSTINNSTPTPAAKGAVESPGTSSSTGSRSMNQAPSMNQSGSMNMNRSGSMDNSSRTDRSSMDRSAGMASRSDTHARTHHVARNSGADARENQETRELNLRQLAGNSASMAPNGSMGYSSGMSSSGAGNPFNNGSPQQAQGGGANCTPDNPSCGTARQNPAINSSPQHRTYGVQE
jgi:hypothetical protein